MSLRSTPPLKLSSIFAEFGAVADGSVEFSQLVKGGDYVTTGVSGGSIPTALPMSMSNFLGATSESRLVLVSTSASSGSLSTVADPNGYDVRLDWTHPSVSDSSSKTASALITLVYRLGNPPPGRNLYLSCQEGSNGSGYYKSYGSFTLMPGANGSSSTDASQPTYGVDQTSSLSGGSAEVRTDLSQLISAGPAMTNRLTEAVLLALNTLAGMTVTIQLSVSHTASNDSGFAYFVHQGTAVVYFNPTFLVMSAGVVYQELPFRIELHTAGQITMAPP